MNDGRMGDTLPGGGEGGKFTIIYTCKTKNFKIYSLLSIKDSPFLRTTFNRHLVMFCYKQDFFFWQLHLSTIKFEMRLSKRDPFSWKRKHSFSHDKCPISKKHLLFSHTGMVTSQCARIANLYPSHIKLDLLTLPV